MFKKYRIIKSVDNEGRKVITYIKNSFDKDGETRSHSEKEPIEKFPEAVQVTVKLS